jgi:hypothetical protein
MSKIFDLPDLGEGCRRGNSRMARKDGDTVKIDQPLVSWKRPKRLWKSLRRD